MNTANTLKEAIDLIDGLDLERFSKHTLYLDLKYGYSFGAANEHDLLHTRKRKFAVYTYYLPDGASFHCAGELLENMVKNARQRIRAVHDRDVISEASLKTQDRKEQYNKLTDAGVGDVVPGRLAEYGWVDYLAGGPTAAPANRGGGALAQTPERRPPAAQRKPHGSGEEADDQSQATSAATASDLQDADEDGVSIQPAGSDLVGVGRRSNTRRRRRNG
jgi:hypothetical protein